ncbi:major tail protein, partial [Schleiferilactobacillus shenzhenensis]
MGKVKIGTSAFEYGLVANDLVAAPTTKVPGLTSVQLELTNDLKTIPADDAPYVTLSSGITETKLTAELMDLPSQAKVDWFGIKLIGGTEVYNKDLTPNDIAVLFKTKDENG